MADVDHQVEPSKLREGENPVQRHPAKRKGSVKKQVLEEKDKNVIH